MALENDISALVSSMDLALYDTAIVNENSETIYRVSVMSNEIIDGKRKGVSLDSCVDLTHLLSPLLDVTPPVSGEYRLEVGSPGIERKLSSLKHFEMSIGDNVHITTKEKTKISGVIKAVEGSQIIVDTDDASTSINFCDISKAKTYFEW